MLLHTRGKINSALIDSCFHLDHENQWRRQQIIPNFPKEIEKLMPGQTFTIKRRNQFGHLDLEIVEEQKEFDNEQSQDIHKAQLNFSIKKGNTLHANKSNSNVKDLIGFGQDFVDKKIGVTG